MTAAKPTKPGSLSQLQHSAGIFADASIDGPEIGTLVLVVDRAKNLPNRKTIGKQDPYCAARLAKEAHKTRTDIRGGQTPRWDQELRFKVHDSPDYYQLKLSIFNDDKKTDLIGETWIDLKEIIKPGGGQNDRWQSLGCRGKYAGEIRIELTYYDNRPKPVAVPHPVGLEAGLPASDAAAGSARRKSPVKRRPLPSDPVTGEVPSHVNPSQVLRTAPSTSHMAIPPQMQDTVTQPHRVGPRPQPTTRAEQQQQAALAQKQKVLRLQKQQQELLEQQQLQQQKLQRALAEKEAAAVAAANAVAVAAVSSSPPLAQPFHHDQYGNPVRPENPPVSPHAHQDHRRASASHNQPHPLDPQYAQYHEQSPSNYQEAGSVPNPGSAYGQQPPPPNRHPSYDGSVQVDDAPPPPPAHRSRGSSTPMQLQQDLGLRNGYGSASPPRPNGMRQEVLRNQAHRNPPTGSDRSSYGPGPGPSQYQGRPQSQTLSHRLSMQPTVEDVPDSPNAGSQTVIRKSIGPSQLNPNADPRRESASAEQYQQHQPSQVAPQTHQGQQLPPAPPHQYQPSPPAHNSAPPQPPVSSVHPPEPASRHQQTQHHHAAPLAPQYDATPPPAPQHQSMQFQSHSHVQPPARPEHFQHQSSPSQAQSYQEPPQNHTQPYQANGNASHAIPPLPMQERHEAASPYSTSPQPEPSPIEESSSMAMTLVSRPNARKSQGPQIPASLIPGVDPIIAQEISELAHQKRQRERGFSYPTSIKTFSYHPAQGQYQQQPQGQLPAPPQYQQANSQQNQYQENSHGYPQRGRSMTTTEIVPYGYTGRGPSPNLYDDRNSSSMPYLGHDPSSRRNSGREPSPNPYPSSQGQDQVGYNHRNSTISYGSASSQHQAHHSQQMIRHGERSPSPNPYSGRGPSPNPYSGRGPSPNPYSRRGSSPNPHSGGPSPNPYSGRSPSPNPYSGRNPSPNQYAGNGVSPNPRDGRSPSPNPYSRHGASPNVRSGRSPSPNPSPRPSPNTQYTIRRKSVSPAPLLSQSRRSSTVPFNPASYDEYNTNSLVERTNVNTQDKIIMHDGREVDPSDHLPFESWAPEPDRPGDENGMQSSSPQPLGRPRPEGPSAYPGPSGRRQLKIAGHTPKPQAQIGYGGNDATQAPAPQSRNRLQKKSNRPSIGPPNQSTSPLAPVSNNYQDNFNPSRPTRAHSWDYTQENNPAYNPNGHRHGMNEPPSVPPKVSPTSGALVRVAPPRGAPPTNPDDWALMEEMQRIDIGAGRSRRHGGY